MNYIQKNVILVSFILTLLIVIFDNIFPGAFLIRFFKLFVIIYLFLRALTIEKKHPVQRLFNLALFFTAAGDLVFVVAHTRPMLFSLVTPLGAAFFAAAYLILLNVFAQNGKISFYKLLVLLLLLGLYLPVFFKYFLHVPSPLIYALFLFCLVLCSMTWRAVCTILEKYYTLHTSVLMALAGILIFLSDTFVGLAVYEPAFSGLFVPWLENVIWGTFILAWTIIVLLTAEENLVRKGA